MITRATLLLLATCTATAAALALRSQEDPASLAHEFVKAADAGDRSALEALVHPDVARFHRARDLERWEEVLDSWARTRFEPDHDVVVRPAAEVELYNEERHTLVLGDRLQFRFPLHPPSHFLIMRIRAPADSAPASDRTDIGGSNAVEAVFEQGGRWSLTVPVVEIRPD